jgi:hypothetical protein
MNNRSKQNIYMKKLNKQQINAKELYLNKSKPKNLLPFVLQKPIAECLPSPFPKLRNSYAQKLYHILAYSHCEYHTLRYVQTYGGSQTVPPVQPSPPH